MRLFGTLIKIIIKKNQMSKYVDNSVKLNYDEIRTYVRIVMYERGIKIMTDHKTELLRLILENDNIEQAIMTASVIISDLLKQHESLEEQTVSCLPVSDQMSSSF